MLQVVHALSLKKFNTALTSSQSIQRIDDSAFDALSAEIKEKKSHIWNSLEIQGTYSNHGGILLTRHRLFGHLMYHFGDELHVFTGNEVACLIIFNSNVPDLLKLTDDNNYIDLRQIARKIKKECSEKPPSSLGTQN